MAENPPVQSRTINEAVNRVRRLIGDFSPGAAVVNPLRVREVVLSNYVELIYDIGADQRTEENFGGTEEWTYVVNAGDTRTTEIENKEIVAIGTVTNNQTTVPMEKKERHTIETWIANDIRSQGAAIRGIPKFWTPEVYFKAADNKMAYRFKFYPAADRQLTIYVPHTVMDAEVIDSTNATAPSMLSYIGVECWIRRSAAELIIGMTPEQLARLGLTVAYGQALMARAAADFDAAQTQATIGHHLSEIQEYRA